MNRSASVLTLAVFYPVGIGIATALNADYVTADAVLGPVTVAILYTLFMSPAAVSAALVLVVARFTSTGRAICAFAFSGGVFLAVEFIFAFAASARWHQLVISHDIAIIVAANVALSCSFAAVGKSSRFVERAG